MSDFGSQILNNELKGNLRNCRRSLFGFGMSTCRKSYFISGIGEELSDKFFFNSVDSFSATIHSKIEFLNFLKNGKLGERKFRLFGFLRVFSHFFLARLTLEVDLTRRLKFLANQCSFLRMYRGFRKFFFLPCRGQRTRTNASSRKLVADRRKVKTFRHSRKAPVAVNWALLKYKVDQFYGRLANLSAVNRLSLTYNIIKCLESHLVLNLNDIFEFALPPVDSNMNNLVEQVTLKKKHATFFLSESLRKNKVINSLRRKHLFQVYFGEKNLELFPQINFSEPRFLETTLYFDFFFKYEPGASEKL